MPGFADFLDKMKTTLSLLVFILLGLSVSRGQMLETESESNAEITKIGFMVGKWKGSGLIMGRDQQRNSFEQTEDVRFKLDNTAILIEGLGNTDGKVIHNALVVISFNKQENSYNFQSYMSNGSFGSFKAELIDN